MVLPVTPSLFARDLSGAYKKAERKNRPDGFFETLAKGVATGVATGLGQEAASQLISKPLEAYNASQQAKRDEFLATENIADARRNNAVLNNYVKAYRDALDRSETNNTDFNVEFSKEKLFTEPAFTEFRKKQFVRDGKTDAFSDQEILDLSADARIAEVKKNRETFDAIYKQAKGIRDVDQFKNFLNREAPRTRGLILGMKDRLTSKFRDKSVGQLAEERVLNDARYAKTLEGLSALESYRNTRDEGAIVTAMRNLKLKDIPTAYYLQSETDIEEKSLGGGNYVIFLKKKESNLLANTVQSSSTMIPGSERFGLTIADRLTDVRKLMKDNNMSDEIVPDFSERAKEIIENEFPSGVMSNTGKRKPYNYLRPQEFATAEG